MPNAESQSPPTLPNSLGEVLGNLRCNSGATQAELAVRLRLTIAQIKALEEDRVEGFPAPAYYLRAARSYAYHFNLGEAFDAWVCRAHEAPHPLHALASQTSNPVRIVLVSERHKDHSNGAKQHWGRAIASDGSLRARGQRLIRPTTTGIGLILFSVVVIVALVFTEFEVSSIEPPAPRVTADVKDVSMEPVVMGQSAVTPASAVTENPALSADKLATPLEQVRATEDSPTSPCDVSLGRWIAAWRTIDFRSYIAAYSREFKYDGGGYEQFARGRNAVFSRKTFIDIEISAITWSKVEGKPTHWVAEFHQRYRSNDYTWEGNKRVLWHSALGGCLIVAETSS